MNLSKLEEISGLTLTLREEVTKLADVLKNTDVSGYDNDRADEITDLIDEIGSDIKYCQRVLPDLENFIKRIDDSYDDRNR